MKKAILVAALALVFVLGVPSAADRGPWKVSCWQSGVETDALQMGAEFEIRGEGFHAQPLPVKVCLNGGSCQLAEPDRGGGFSVRRTISRTGTYEVQVLQARDLKISEWRKRASRMVTVTE